MSTEKHPALKQMIMNVIENGNTLRQILNKISEKYPDYYYGRVIGNEEKILPQMYTEINNVMEQLPEIFTVNKSGKLNRYNLK